MIKLQQNTDYCGCNACTQSCPQQCISIKSRDEEIRRQSSSGGIFTLLAERVLDENGIVFGARVNEHWEVTHDYVETKDELGFFRGSKYVQSRTGKSYLQAQQFLEKGRKVLFSGTPCQISGLKFFRGSDITLADYY
jgi:coenzyme F420-reducing hydrogenase beta subunit